MSHPRKRSSSGSGRRHFPVIPCGVAIIRDGRRFLISQRSAEDTFGSFWEFPGGKKDPHESFEECVVRETREELGIEVAVQKKFMEIRRTYHNKVIWLNFYICAHIGGDPRPIECQRVLWADADELKKFTFPPANELVIARLIAELQAPARA